MYIYIYVYLYGHKPLIRFWPTSRSENWNMILAGTGLGWDGWDHFTNCLNHFYILFKLRVILKNEANVSHTNFSISVYIAYSRPELIL